MMMDRLAIYLRIVAWAWAFLKLIVKAGTVWGCRPDWTLEGVELHEDYAMQLMATPLKYEHERLETIKDRIIHDWGKLG